MTPISLELQEQIEREAEAYQQRCDATLTFMPILPAEHYKAGVGLYATRWEQAKKALEEIVKVHDQYHRLNGDNPAANHLRNIAIEVLDADNKTTISPL